MARTRGPRKGRRTRRKATKARMNASPNARSDHRHCSCIASSLATSPAEEGAIAEREGPRGAARLAVEGEDPFGRSRYHPLAERVHQEPDGGDPHGEAGVRLHHGAEDLLAVRTQEDEAVDADG